ncbi:MAG: hypothetical protein K9N51_06085 [Candidatus Pacebacteria bacterium]|nr:hypothetical protein [Candidatus Paceibacterota bacterium]
MQPYILFTTVLYIMVMSLPASAGELRDDLLFHASFEHTVNADVAKGDAKCHMPPDKKQVLTYTLGIKGKAASQNMSYASKGNILPEQGTLLMWVQPLTWQADDGGTVHFFQTNHVMRHGKLVSSLLLYKYRRVPPDQPAQMWISNKLNVFAATAEERDGHIITRHENRIPVSISGWSIGEWHHLALSWNRANGLVKLYVDGFHKGTSRMPLPEFFSGTFTIGGSHVPRNDTAFDEVRIYNRPLTLDEIRGVLLEDKYRENSRIPESGE